MSFPGRYTSNKPKEVAPTIRYVHIDSDEFKAFIRKLESNYQAAGKYSACLLCWGFLASH